jgi:hypothetical protein
VNDSFLLSSPLVFKHYVAITNKKTMHILLLDGLTVFLSRACRLYMVSIYHCLKYMTIYLQHLFAGWIVSEYLFHKIAQKTLQLMED